MLKSNTLLVMILLVNATVLWPNKAFSQAGNTSAPVSSPPDSNNPITEPPKQLSLLGIYRGEALRLVAPHLTSIGFKTILCSTIVPNPKFEGQCFKRGVDENVSVWFKNGVLNGVGYDISGSLYDAVWNGLQKRFGNPKAFKPNGGWLFDFWQNKNKTDAMEIMKIMNRTGEVTLKEYDQTYDFIGTVVASSPSEYSERISGKLSKVEDVENAENPRTPVPTQSAASMLRTAALSLELHSGMSQARVKAILVAHGYDGIHEMGQSSPWSHPWDCQSNNWANGRLVASCISRKGGVQISIDFLLGKAHADPDTGELIGVRMDHLYHANFFYMVQSGEYRHFDLWEPNNGFVTKCDDCKFF